MNTSKGQPIFLINLFFIVAIMIWAAQEYTDRISDLREIIDHQDTAIIMQQTEIDLLYRSFLPHIKRPGIYGNPLYDGFKPNPRNNASVIDE
jgi:hypothetical protein